MKLIGRPVQFEEEDVAEAKDCVLAARSPNYGVQSVDTAIENVITKAQGFLTTMAGRLGYIPTVEDLE